MIRVTNNERAVLIRDNKTLRTTVECGRTVKNLITFFYCFVCLILFYFIVYLEWND